MHLVQILLPLADNNNEPYGPGPFQQLKQDLTQEFGGVTAYMRAPAAGQWMDHDAIQRDDVIIVEVMVDTLDRTWWRTFRQRLERELEQREIVLRAQAIERL
jgi:hypothetical protein